MTDHLQAARERCRPAQSDSDISRRPESSAGVRAGRQPGLPQGAGGGRRGMTRITGLRREFLKHSGVQSTANSV